MKQTTFLSIKYNYKKTNQLLLTPFYAIHKFNNLSGIYQKNQL